MDKQKIAKNRVKRLQRGNNSDKMDETMSINSKLYRKYMDAKRNLTRLK